MHNNYMLLSTSTHTSITRHLCQDDDITAAEQSYLIDLATDFARGSQTSRVLAGPRSVAVLLEKPSTRTRVSFQVAIAELGGNPVMIDAGTTQLTRVEPMTDVARVLGGYVSAIVIRAESDRRLYDCVQAAGVPVINALTPLFHPCQALADLTTLTQHFGGLSGLTLTYCGDISNNMAHSYALAGAVAGMNIRLCGPQQLSPNSDIIRMALARAQVSGGSIRIMDSVDEAVSGADAIATDVWTSMDQTDSADKYTQCIPYSVTETMLAQAPRTTVVLHCLPAHRGQEIAASVIDGPRSLVWKQAQNRLHAQKALLTWLLDSDDPSAMNK